MSRNRRDGREDAPLNPALKADHEGEYDTERTAAPLETVSVADHQHSSWPVIWLVVAGLCVALTVYLLFG